jgi:hypothetical protein
VSRWPPPPRSFWIWTAINIPAFLICFFVLAGACWSLGEQYFVPWYPVPSNDYLGAHGEEFAQVQLLFAGIPALLCALLIVAVTVWRHRQWLRYVLGAILGLLLGTYALYSTSLHNRFDSMVAIPLDLRLLLVHWAHAPR